LDSVANKLLGERKMSVKHSEIEKLWNGDSRGLEKLVNYCLKDSILAMNLVLKLNLLDKYIALSKVSGTLLQDTLSGGETSRIENFLLQEFNKEGFVFPCKPEQVEVEKRERVRKTELKGGFVLEPKKGLHNNVIVLDFKSMYPSIIRTYNICPTTLIKNTDVKNAIETPSGARFVPRDVREGIIPKILEKLMKERQIAKKKLAKETDPIKKRVYFSKQWALKIMANAFYGYLGYARARIYDLSIANAVTSLGREIIQKTKAIIEREYGYTVVYGDTDSVMVKVQEEDMDKIREIGNRLSREITERLPGVMELEFEKVFKRFLPLTKKRYAAWKFEPKDDGWRESIEMKGIETVRRDWCELVGDTMKNIIDIILKKNDVKGAMKYFNEIVKKLVRGDIDIQKLVITKTMTKTPKTYAGMQPHIELVKKIQARNPGEAPGIGDRVGYVIIKGLGLLSKRAEDPNYVIEKGLEIDSRYYIDNQLLPPLERIFGALNISKSELLGNGKQMGIFEVIMREDDKGKRPERVLITDVNGFICERCNRFYQRVPLIGRCECGGSILFSTPAGAVEEVVVNS
ncbi:MAG TPA: DNA polymerase elongation subunit, partial [Candidatus Aenigmarchaeota archaeon]|nr:DNA polymerase elongation subunit [Candidatus Aenigmarchaeota archaeon]